MRRFVRPNPSDWPAIIRRSWSSSPEVRSDVQAILDRVRTEGDEALRSLTSQLDGVQIDEVRVPQSEIDHAGETIPFRLREAIAVAAGNIERFHAAQKEDVRVVETMPGVRCWRRSIPIESVGLYVPGGSAPLFSTLLMLGIPARIAGCRRVVACSPPESDGQIAAETLYVASVVGVTELYRVGGAQAVGALSFGTESIRPVDKVFGPGNRWVTAAKQEVQLEGVAVDLPAGPTEVAIVADESANPEFVAADLLSQAEHGADSHMLLVCFDSGLVDAIESEIASQIQHLSRKTIAEQALANSVAVVVASRDEALALTDEYAPEHLILATAEAEELADRVLNAGSVFVGHYSPEAVGDYASGTNHTLPTAGFARAFSGVSLDSFVKKVTFQELTPTGIRAIGPHVEEMALAEGLDGHRGAVRVRLDGLDSQT